MMWDSLFENVTGLFSGSATEKKTRPRKRVLQIETLEDRDLLSVTPVEPLALDFLAHTSAIVFTPPALANGTHSATPTTTTATTLDMGDGTILVGTLTQTFDITVEIVMCTTTHAWSYTETVIMSYEETFNGATFWGGYEYVFTAWSNATGTGFTFDSTANDDYLITLDNQDGLLTITGFATSNIFITSLSSPNLEFFSEFYGNSATQITEFQGASGAFDTFEHASSLVSNTLTITTLENGNIETTLIGSETVTLQYDGVGLLTSETLSDAERNALIPSGGSFTLTNFVSTVDFSYTGFEFYTTNYEIVSLETPYELLSLEGSSTTIVFSFQSWSDSSGISYTLTGADGTYNISSGNGVGGIATSDAEWSSALNAHGDWVLIDGNSHVFGNDYTSLFSNIAFFSKKTEQEEVNGNLVVSDYTLSGTHNFTESEGNIYDIEETVSGGEWVLVSGSTLSSLFGRSETNNTTITGTLTVTSDDATVTWDTSNQTFAKERVSVEMHSEASASGNWTTEGIRESHTSGFESSRLSAEQKAYQSVVNGMSVSGTYDSTERNRVDYEFSTEESFNDGEWGNATGSGWTRSSATTTTEWSANSEVSKNYGARLNSNGVKDTRLLGSTPLNNGETKVTVSGTFTKEGFESLHAESDLHFQLVGGSWQSTSGSNVLTTTRNVRMDYELTTDGGDVTITESGFTNDRFHSVIGHDSTGNRALWGQATIGHENRASITVDYANDSIGSDTFASSHSIYNTALVLMLPSDNAASYPNQQLVPFDWHVDSPNIGTQIFAVTLSEPTEKDEESGPEWKTIFWNKTFITVQEVSQSQTHNASGTSSSSGSRTEVTIRDSGGMMDTFAPDDSGGTVYTPPDDGDGGGPGNGGGTWTPGTQTYELVDGNDWNRTTLLTIGNMTGTKTVAGSVETTFFSVGDGTAWETYNFTNTESGSVRHESAGYGHFSSGCFDGHAFITSTSSYSFSNSITKDFHTDFIYDEVNEKWVATGGTGETEGARSWERFSEVNAIREESSSSSSSSCSGNTSCSHWQSLETTETSSGNYSDNWSSTSKFLNGAWTLTSGTMTGSGSLHDKTKTHNESTNEYSHTHASGDNCGCGCGSGCGCGCGCGSGCGSGCGCGCGSGCGCGCGSGGACCSYNHTWSSSTWKHTTDEYFTITQTVENGDWKLSSRDVTIDAKSSTNYSSGYGSYLYDAITNQRLSGSTTSNSNSVENASTKVFNLSGLVSSEWTVERNKTYNWLGEGYGLTQSRSLSYSEFISSCGEAAGSHHETRVHASGKIVTVANRDANGVSGVRQTFNSAGALISTVVIDNNNFIFHTHFASAWDPFPFLSPSVSPQQGDLPPPPPPQKPAVPTTASPQRSWWNIPGQVYDAVKGAINDMNNMRPDAQMRAQALAAIADPDYRHDGPLRAFLPLPKSGVNTISNMTNVYLGTAGMVMPALATTTAARAAPVISAANQITNNHHAIPKFLGGAPNQTTVSIPKQIHVDFHKDLGQALKAQFGLPVGGAKGSTTEWGKYFSGNAGKQKEAMVTVLNESLKHGTDIFNQALKTLKTPGMVQWYK